MSYILDALKKADQERTLGDVPDLETAHWGERRVRRAFRWVWVVAALLLVNGALLLFLLGRDDGGSGSDIAMTANETVNRQREYAQLRKESAVVQPSQTITRPREPVYVPAAPAQRSRPAVQYAPAPVEVEPPSYMTQPDAAIVLPPASTRSSGIPSWDELSLEFRSGLVLPHIDVHVYDDDPSRRFILVNLEKFREGETLDSGIVIERINESTIQLNHRGTSFLMGN